LAQLALAAGAKEVQSLHVDPLTIKSVSEIDLLNEKSYGALEHGIFTAHQMGGLAMGVDPQKSVVNPEHRHHRIKNLYVVDGSIFPTSVGVNPSQTIYTLAHRARERIKDALR
jgi:choline dehydrogenase-like flavoprotein